MVKSGAIELWRASDGALLLSIPYPTSVHNVHFSPSGAQLIAGGVDQRATVWNIPAGTLALTLNGIADEMADATFSPDGKQIASTSAGGNGVRIWDAATGTLLQTMSGHANYVSSVVWVGNDRIISGDWQGNVISWTRTSHGGVRAVAELEHGRTGPGHRALARPDAGRARRRGWAESWGSSSSASDALIRATR